MSTVILRTVKHRLADLMSKPGGPSIQTALQNAEAALQARAASILELCGTKVSALEALPPGDAMARDDIETAYGLASDIVDICGVMPMPALFGASYSLCEILDHFRSHPFSRSAFDVHVHTMRLILTHGANPAIEALVAQLAAVKARVLKQPVKS